MTTPISDEQLAELEGYSQHPAFLGDEDSAITMGELRGLIARLRAAEADAKRYRWLRNPDQDVSLVLDKVSGEVPADEFGCGGYLAYEYRSGDELDAAIDAAMERTP
ncbi:TPA: hypothetical protein ACGJ7L_006471 [Pseudomonas aeruginosa]|uniref:Uncharacterized protein n=1 Tax=Pseudomonas aeruginosa TaxID=287 RepID=A0A9P1R2Q6_PSEAI|nr:MULTISPECIES: hypothetical protein [Pseudomonas]CDI94979.1 hypothetical protein BN889_06979 [Pseudomonas aeruginosa PA38182]HCL2855034.1 hypothetical protein [Pseudomonas aeruginosa 1BAE]AKE70322.1 hypothetical protein YQ19_19515 [Pseudomonas aeruginosa]ARG50663.1 hypothetical protein BFV99_15435 [Pseudomonas aeruginosa]EIU2683171.1 hypothetical protein [Pseudomonas aeruginosa]